MPEESLGAIPEVERTTSPIGVTSQSESFPRMEAESLPEQSDVKGERYTQLLSRVQQTSVDEADIEEDAKEIGAIEAAEQKVHTLIGLAQVKGVAHAVRVAKRMNDLYVLDTMHDELADKLYDGLLAQGLISKE